MTTVTYSELQPMSAIAGAIYPDPFQVQQLARSMLSVLGHRGGGKVASETHRNGQIGSFATTLSHNERRTVWVGYDAQIANQEDLTKDLQEAGIALPDKSLGTLLVAAYELWGSDFVSHLNGDFAIAVLDKSREELLLFRDRLGKKPLYWFHQNNHFFFASELKALLSTGVVPQTPAVDAIATYLFLGYIPQDTSAILHVNKLLPGYSLRIRFNGHKRIVPYWSCSSFFCTEVEEKGDAIQDKIDSLLRSEIERRTSGEVTGCFVGGGLGSATVASYLRNPKPTALTTIFEGETQQDLDAAESVARALRLPHEHRSLSLDRLLKDLVPVIWYLDEPLADPNIITSWHLTRIAKEAGIHTVFSGMGADELLGAHLRYHSEGRASSFTRRLAALPSPLVRKLIIPLIRGINPRLSNRVLRHSLTNPSVVAFLKHHAVFRERQLRRVSPALAPYFDSDVFVQKFYQMVTIKKAGSNSQYIDIKTRLPDLYMAQMERLTTAAGLRWETPFLASPLVEYLAAIPAEEKGNPGGVTSPLQRLMNGVLPQEFLKRPKGSRRHHLDGWRDKTLMQEAMKLLQNGSLVEAGFVSPSWLKRAATRAHFTQLFSILVLEIWFRLYINNPIREQAPKVWVSELLRSRV